MEFRQLFLLFLCFGAMVHALSAADTAFLDYLAKMNPKPWRGVTSDYCSRTSTVTCDNTGQYLLAVKLNDAEMSGALSFTMELQYLTSLSFRGNKLTSFSLNFARRLEKLDVASNLLTTLPSVPSAVTSMDISKNMLPTLTVNARSTLQALQVGGNPMKILKLSSLPALTTLGLEDLTALNELSLVSMAIPALQLDNQRVLTSLELNALSSLTSLRVIVIPSLLTLRLVDLPKFPTFNFDSFFPMMTSLTAMRIPQHEVVLRSVASLKDLTLKSMSALTSVSVLNLQRLETATFGELPLLSSLSVTGNMMLKTVSITKVNAVFADFSRNALETFTVTADSFVDSLSLASNRFVTIPTLPFEVTASLDIRGNTRLGSIAYSSDKANARLSRLSFDGCDAIKGVTLKNLAVLSTLTPLVRFPSLAAVELANIALMNSYSIMFLPALTTITVASVPMGELLLQNLPNLKALNLFSTQMTSLNFESLPASLLNVHIEAVPLRSIYVRDLQNLERLEVLKMGYMETMTLSNLPNLRDVALAQTPLEKLWYYRLPKLSNISLEGFSYIREVNFFELSALTSISLKSIPSLYWVALEKLPNLKSLVVVSTAVTNVEDVSLRNVPSLVSLDMTSNNLIGFTLSSMPSLTSLTLRHGSSLDDVVLRDLPSLSVLSITLPQSLRSLNLSNLPKLPSLSLSSYGVLNSVSLTALPSLASLTITGSAIDAITADSLPILSSVDLVSNAITSLASLRLPESIESLKISGNKFNAIEIVNKFKALTSLDCYSPTATSIYLDGLPALARLYSHEPKSLILKNLNRLPLLTTAYGAYEELELVNLNAMTALRFGSASNLKRMTVANANSLTLFDTRAPKLSELSVINMPRLSTFRLSGTLVRNDLASMIRDIGSSSLTGLFVGNNQLTGKLPERLPSSFDVSNNYLYGVVPTALNPSQSTYIRNCFASCPADCRRREDCPCLDFDGFTDVCKANPRCQACANGNCREFGESC